MKKFSRINIKKIKLKKEGELKCLWLLALLENTSWKEL